MVRILMILSFLAGLFVSAGNISRQETLLRALASDELKGRATGSPEIDKAAALIAAQFKEAGLGFYGDLPNYYQKFMVTEISPGTSSLSLNGTSISADKFVVLSEAAAFDVTDISSFKVVTLGPEDDLRSGYGAMMQGNVLVLLDPAHDEMFQMFKKYITGPKFIENPNPKKVSVIVVTAEKEITNIDLKGKTIYKSMELTNVIGVLKGKRADEQVMFSAHYDHLGEITPENGDAIANGANDNASGTSVVTELAHHFSGLGQPERSLVFIAFTAEEAGLVGSKYMAAGVDPTKVVAGINLEMLGEVGRKGKGYAFVTGHDKTDLYEIMNKAVAGEAFGFFPDPFPQMGLFYRSDNLAFAQKGIPFHSVSSGELTPESTYHTVRDEVKEIDFEHLALMTKAIAKSVKPIVDGVATPTRVQTKN